LHVDLGAEPHDVGGPGEGVGVEPVEGFLPGGKGLAGVGVYVAAGSVVPFGEAVDVDRVMVGWPPDLVVGGGHDLADDVAGDGPTDRGVEVGRETALGFDRGEVLGSVAGGAAQVLPKPVDELGEVEGVEGGAPVVVARRVDRDALAGDPPIGGHGEGEEH
jgi:hypothetical protein